MQKQFKQVIVSALGNGLLSLPVAFVALLALAQFGLTPHDWTWALIQISLLVSWVVNPLKIEPK